MIISGTVVKPAPAYVIEIEPTPAPEREEVSIGVLTEELNTPETKGLIVASLVSEEVSKLTVEVVTLETCPVYTASLEIPALTTAYCGEVADPALIVDVIEPATPPMLDA